MWRPSWKLLLALVALAVVDIVLASTDDENRAGKFAQPRLSC